MLPRTDCWRPETPNTGNMSCKAGLPYVDVVARFDKDGVMMPMAFVWEDGRKYEIDKVKSKERCASRKAGGTGIMYTVVVAGKECHLYFEFDKWFMERKFA